QLTAEIVAGGVPPGDALPPERALTEQLGVNRQAVREALQRMALLGLVDIRHGEATRVRDFRSSASPELLTWLIVRPDGSIDAAVVRSVFELRATVGADAARLCASRAVPATVGLRPPSPTARRGRPKWRRARCSVGARPPSSTPSPTCHPPKGAEATVSTEMTVSTAVTGPRSEQRAETLGSSFAVFRSYR